MLALNSSAQFRKDYKLCIRRGLDPTLLQTVIDTLRIPAALPVQQRDHPLSGEWIGHRECHILPNWLLIYQIHGENLYLVRTGTHSDLFRK